MPFMVSHSSLILFDFFVFRVKQLPKNFSSSDLECNLIFQNFFRSVYYSQWKRK